MIKTVYNECESIANKYLLLRAQKLLLAADEDWMCHADFSLDMARLIPNAQLSIFENCGHILPIDQNHRYFETVRSFFKK